ncbi:DNA-binding IclR family transcriptional regulator [Acidovorax soli]|uniref:DNA-binding IclR family transcriptional regulator n=1 Tax=Acidovorax soli TaxID=592050 RepID=A0A7X0PLF9_9BURK|nr:IclR family transcriptional regulator C-terminal domain-containing protein [Acidovorax soli]MBB6564125.1 DNA-binding IclR family transcriptional regulator [Acidovorax soli]
MSVQVKSAQRVLDLLEFFAEERRPASVGVIAQSLGWPQSSTSVLMKCLAESGHFDLDAQAGQYAPSVRLALATAWIQEHQYSERNLLRLMEQVQAETGHTVMVANRRDTHVRYLHVLQSTREGRFTARSGALRPLFHSAAGKMLLSTLAQREVASLLRKANAQEVEPGKRRDFADVCQEITTIRAAGYALSRGSAMPGAAALAVLLPVAQGREPMTLSLGGPIREIESEFDALLATLRKAVEPIRRMTEA